MRSYTTSLIKDIPKSNVIFKCLIGNYLMYLLLGDIASNVPIATTSF